MADDRNAVLEEAAKVADQYAASEKEGEDVCRKTGPFQNHNRAEMHLLRERLARHIAESIRAMKSNPVMLEVCSHGVRDPLACLICTPREGGEFFITGGRDG